MTEEMITNEEKRIVYAVLKAKLKVALQQEFYLEALLLEYNIMEDRLTSILKHSGISYLQSNGKEIGIQKSWTKYPMPYVTNACPSSGKLIRDWWTTLRIGRPSEMILFIEAASVCITVKKSRHVRSMAMNWSEG